MKTEYIRDRPMSNIIMTISSNNKRKHEDEEKGSVKQARVTRIPLAISKQESYLTQLSLVEYLPAERIRALLKSGHLKDKWGNPSYSQCYAKRNYENEKEQLNTYLKRYDRRLRGSP